MIDTTFLDGDLSSVPFMPAMTPKHGVFFDGPSFWFALRGMHLDRVDILTFSVGDVFFNTPIDRLIIGSPDKRRFKPKSVPETRSGYKVYANLHAKMVIGWSPAGSLPRVVAVGSLNLCDSSSGEIMLITQSWHQEEHLCKYFNQLWDNPKVETHK